MLKYSCDTHQPHSFETFVVRSLQGMNDRTAFIIHPQRAQMNFPSASRNSHIRAKHPKEIGRKSQVLVLQPRRQDWDVARLCRRTPRP